jgi:hypothetical protein
MTGRKIPIPRGWKLKGDKLVPDDRHLPVNLRLQKRAKQKVRVSRRRTPPCGG